MLKYLIQTSIFRYSKNYCSLTHETRIKDAVNMEDLICLLATVRTLKLDSELFNVDPDHCDKSKKRYNWSNNLCFIFHISLWVSLGINLYRGVICLNVLPKSVCVLFCFVLFVCLFLFVFCLFFVFVFVFVFFFQELHAWYWRGTFWLFFSCMFITLMTKNERKEKKRQIKTKTEKELKYTFK